jgi:Fic family protein
MWDNGLAPVLRSVATAFGFIYIHPFQDGNGRVHRCLIHNVLAERKHTPPGMVFPVSSVMLDRIDDYCTTLQAHSALLMDVIEWRPTQ